MALDKFDLSILRVLQRDNTTPQRQIGEAVGLSTPSVQRRIKRMEAEKVIVANTATVAPEAVGLSVTVIVEVQLSDETPVQIEAAKAKFIADPSVQQCHYVTGEADFILTLVLPNMQAYQEFSDRTFFKDGNVKKFRTFVSMDHIKGGASLNF